MLNRIPRQSFSLVLRIAIYGLCLLVVLTWLALESADGQRATNDVLRVVPRLAALWGSGAALCLFALYGWRAQPTGGARTIVLIVVLGSLVRMFLAVTTFGNFDMASYTIVANIVSRGGNVYAETTRYNYSPVWFTVLHILDQIPVLPLFVKVRLFLTGVDLLTVVLLIRIAAYDKQPPVRAVLFFYLNPVSFLLTGFHGQFENISVLFLLLGVLCYFGLQGRRAAQAGALWVTAALAMLVKHNVAYQVVNAACHAVRSRWQRIGFVLLAGLVFAVSFIPFLDAGGDTILTNVVLYASIPGWYGITTLVRISALYYPFTIAIMLYPALIKTDDLIERYLLGFLFFLCFVTGIGPQYFVLPVALGALRISRGFVIYTILTTLFLLGSPTSVYVPVLKHIHANIVWIGALVWFALSQFEITFVSRGKTGLPFDIWAGRGGEPIASELAADR
ncbi:MAG: hypothetical protein JXJ20_00910 [Anaerolineae bacterium]|nr:hypothetical protein [Anaerolineae bacterium]